jgi:hypothetical protein
MNGAESFFLRMEQNMTDKSENRPTIGSQLISLLQKKEVFTRTIAANARYSKSKSLQFLDENISFSKSTVASFGSSKKT